MEILRFKALACVTLALTLACGASQAADEPDAPSVAAPVAVPADVPAAVPATEAEGTSAPASAAGSSTPAGEGAHPAGAHAPSHAQHPVHRSPEQVLDERIAALGKSLGLDAGQQAQVRKILLVQRDQLRQVWSDPARSSADRIGASQSINNRTEDQIRAILNEEQRKQYIVSKPTGAAGEHPEHGLDYWMDQMQGKH
jgi:hypothetical protein